MRNFAHPLILACAVSAVFQNWQSSDACPWSYEDVCRQRCLELIRRGYYAEAVDSANEALGDRHLSSLRRCWTLVARAKAYAGQKRYGQALADLDAALKLNVEGGHYSVEQEVYAERAKIHQMQKNYEAALVDFDKAVHVGGGITCEVLKARAALRKILGQADWSADEERAAAIAKEQEQQAAGYFRREADSRDDIPLDKRAKLLYAGRAAMKANDYQKACELFTRALPPRRHSNQLSEVSFGCDSAGFSNLNPIEEILLERARAYLAMCKLDLALEDLNQAIASHSGSHPDLLYMRAVVLSLTDDIASAAEDARLAEKEYYRRADIDMFENARSLRKALLSGNHTQIEAAKKHSTADTNSSIHGRLLKQKEVED